MAKKENTGEGIQAGKKPNGMLAMRPVLLITGEWKREFTGRQIKIIIAGALNSCTRNKGLKIAGYLITESRLYLVLEVSKAHLNSMLIAFYAAVRVEIKKHRNHVTEDTPAEYESIGMIKTMEPAPRVFEQEPLNDDNLIKLITGQQVKLPYYNPQLEKLKDHINHEAFCSAIDYSGAVGPVLVKLIKK